jgi:hypothetical protein
MYAHVPAVYSVYSYAVGQGWVKKPKAAKKTGMFVLSIIFVRALVLTLLYSSSAEVRTSDKSEWLKGTIADKNKSSKQN